MLSAEGRFIREYAKLFYFVIGNCVKYWCVWSRYSPYYFKGNDRCECRDEYPDIDDAFNGWGNYLMKQMARNLKFRARLIEAHKAKLGYYDINFFEGKEDPFETIIKDDYMQLLLLGQLKILYKWNPKH